MNTSTHKQFNVKAPAEDLNAFKRACEDNFTTISGVIRVLIAKFLAGETVVDFAAVRLADSQAKTKTTKYY